ASPDVMMDAGVEADAPAETLLFYCPTDAGVSPVATGCPEFVPGSLGNCELSMWDAFQGGSCHPVDTCGPGQPPLPPTLFESAPSCAVTGAAAGKCEKSKIGGQIEPGLPLEGQFCDDVEIEIGDTTFSDALLAELCAIAPDLRCEQPPGGKMRC